MTTVGIYVRISLDQDGEAAGVNRQRKECEALCAKKGWSFVVYEDNDISASRYSRKKRPAYTRLLEDFRNDHIQGIVAYNQDRLTRQNKEWEVIIDIWEEREAKKLVSFLDFTTGLVPDLSEASSRMITRIMAAVSAQESENTSRRVRSQRSEAAMEGKPCLGGNRAFGYAKDGITIVPDEAAVIREAVSRVIAGETPYSVIKDFAARGVVSSKGTPWAIGAFYSMLKSDRICGYRNHKGNRYPAVWEAIITEQEHEAVKAILEARAVTRTKPARKYLLSGLFTCGKCGGSLRGQHKKKPDGSTKLVYRCASDSNRGNGTCYLSVPMAETDQFVKGMVMEIVCSDAYKAARAVAVTNDGPDPIAELSARLLTLEGQLTETETSYLSGNLPLKSFERVSSRIADEQENCRKAIAEASAKATTGDVPLSESELKEAFAGGKPLDWQRALIRSVLPVILVSPAPKNAGCKGAPVASRLSFPPLPENGVIEEAC